MKTSLGFACALLMLGSVAASAAPPGLQMQPANQRQREVLDSAYATHVGYNEVTQITRWRSFDIQSLSNSLGDYQETRINVYQQVDGPNEWGWRYVSCPVPRDALRVKNKSAEVDVTFDTEGTACERYGYRVRYDPDLDEYIYSDWNYFGLVTVQAQLLSPGEEQSYQITEKQSQQDNVSGTSYDYRQSCRGGSAGNMLAGGFTMYGEAIFGDAYFPFETDEADGQFTYRRCSRLDK